jgi:hypothetical protein
MEKRGEIIIYKTEDGKGQIDVRLEQDNIWLNLNQLARLFTRDKSVISRHIKNIFNTKELTKISTVAFFAIVQQEGKRKISREVEFYNLDMVISVGYRVNSNRGTQFRCWATTQLKDHLVKGYTLNEKRVYEQQARWY